MRRPILLSIAALLLAASALGQQMLEKVPITLVDNLMFVEVKVNDSVTPLNFMFDTGAGLTVIDQRVAEQLQLNITGKSNIATSGKRVVAQSSAANRLQIGKHFSLDSVTLEILDLSHLSSYFKFEVEGIIGYDLLIQAIIETNVDESELRIFASKNYKYPGEAPGLTVLELESNNFGLPVRITPQKKGAPITLPLKVDTGAGNHLTIHQPAVEEYQLMDPNKKYKVRRGFGVEATMVSNRKGKLAMVSLGHKTWKKVPVVFEVDPLNRSDKRKGEGLIGQELLLDFNITYHLAEGLMYLELRK